MTRPLPLLPALLLPLLVLTGCTTAPGPAPERSAVPLPGGFSESGDAPLPGRWWQHFDDDALDRLMDDVVDGNFSLAAARARLAQARAAARFEAGGTRPTLDLSGEVSTTRREPGADGEQYSAGAAAAYELDLWGRLEARARAAALEAKATAGDLRAAAISLTAETATTYYGILRQRALIELIRGQAETNRQVEELVELRYRNGTANVDELLRQRQLVESTAADLAGARGELERLRAELAALLGRGGPDALSLPRDQGLVTVPPLPDTGLPARWINRRPDLEAAYQRLQAADARLAAAVADQYPRVDLSAALETAATRPSAVFEDWIARLAGALTVPLFRGGQLEAEVERTRAARAVAFNEFAQTTLDAVAEVETALAAERSDRARVESLERQVELGERVLEQLRFRYRNGAADYLDVLDAQTTLQNSQRQLLQARWALVIDRIDLVRAIAGGWRVDGGSGMTADRGRAGGANADG